MPVRRAYGGLIYATTSKSIVNMALHPIKGWSAVLIWVL